jgi:hypothetical protein
VGSSKKLQSAVVGDHRVFGETAGNQIWIHAEARSINAAGHSGIDASTHVD